MLETLLIIIVGIFIGWKWREISAIQLHRKMQEEKQESRIHQLAEKIQGTFVEATVEKIGDIFYMHNKETGEFLAQGNTSDELSENLRSRFPDKRFVMDKKDLNAIGIYNE